ncbi:MAG TPA: choice-of-anchor J domain-containing protein [Thermoanaerobaculaceae bacterium]|nr:choice-of-anchor J domain-containing protein [Thermoanaerobaculaceae bacterium]
MRHITRVALVAAAVLAAAAASAQMSENFDNVGGLAGAGWALINNSNPLGSTSWFQGNTSVFSSQSGAANSYMAGNFNAAGFGGNISLWALTPVITNLENGEVFSFYTRTETSAPAADRLELRLSLNGASTNVGTTDSSVGDFTVLCLTINPTLAVGGYPSTWTQASCGLAGLPPGFHSGRFAFRYWVTDTSTNGDYIGIDTMALSAPLPVDLSIAKTVDNAAPESGATVTFTVTVTNNSTIAATGVAVTDLLPPGLVFVSATPSQGSYDSGTGVWTVGEVDPGTPQTLLLQATVTAPGQLTNTATITAADQADPDTTNNSASVSLQEVGIPVLSALGVAVLAALLFAFGVFALVRSKLS